MSTKSYKLRISCGSIQYTREAGGIDDESATRWCESNMQYDRFMRIATKAELLSFTRDGVFVELVACWDLAPTATKRG